MIEKSNKPVILTAEEELEILESLTECPYCGPDGTYYTQGLDGIICPHCKGKHYIAPF